MLLQYFDHINVFLYSNDQISVPVATSNRPFTTVRSHKSLLQDNREFWPLTAQPQCSTEMTDVENKLLLLNYYKKFGKRRMCMSLYS